MQKFSERLIALRKEQGLTQTDLAKILNRKRSTISGYEVEGKEPDMETICLIANYFKVSTDYLLGNSEERNNVDQEFFGDTVGFEDHLNRMSTELRPIVWKCFESFYLLLDRDVQLSRPERMRIYEELLHEIQVQRANIRRLIKGSGGGMADPVALSDLMAMQSQMKNSVSALLDKLLQADLEVEFEIKKNGIGESGNRSAM